MTRQRSRGHQAAVLLATAALAVPTLAACGSSSSSAGGGTPTLTIAEQGYNASQMLIYIGLSQGLYKKAGVDLKLSGGLGAAALTQVSAGQADLTTAGTSTPLLLAQKGQATSIVLASVGGGQTGFVVGNPKTAPTLAALQKRSSCKINTYTQASPQYGWAQLLKKKFDLKCSIVPYSDVPSEIAALKGGRGDVIISSYSALASAIDAKQVVPLIDTRDPQQTIKYYGQLGLVSTGVEFGLTSNLKKKRAAVVGYIKGTLAAQKWASAHSDIEIAKILHSNEGFSVQPLALLAEQVKAARSYLFAGSNSGKYTAAQWNQVLQSLALSDVPGFKVSDSAFALSKRVDSSYYDAAR